MAGLSDRQKSVFLGGEFDFTFLLDRQNYPAEAAAGWKTTVKALIKVGFTVRQIDRVCEVRNKSLDDSLHYGQQYT